MLKSHLLNSEIMAVLSHLGHTDTIVIADCGLPIPDHVPRIDLALKLGTPSFTQVFEIVVDEMKVEWMTLASEMEESNPDLVRYFQNHGKANISKVSHEELKKQTTNAKAVIRTGENTPFANVILHAGVIF